MTTISVSQIRPNYIPLPKGQVVASGMAPAQPVAKGAPAVAPTRVAPVMPDVNDLFAKGEVVRYYHALGVGTIRTVHGTEVQFDIKLLDRTNCPMSPEKLKAGMVVGYDVTRTASGERISKIKIYN